MHQNFKNMAITESQTATQLSPQNVIKAMKQFSDSDRQTVWAAFHAFDSDPRFEPHPYVITLREGIPIDEQLDEIWRKRGPINWAAIDEIVAALDIQEPIEELLKSLD